MKLLKILLAASAVAALPGAAHATELYNQLGGPSSTQSISFVAGSGSTAVTFGGYDVPSFSSFTDIYLYASGSTTNLLGTTFNFTPASCGSFASQGGLGAYGTNNLTLAGTCAGFYDQFAQSVSTLAGSSYTLGFSANFASGNSGLRVDASDATISAAVPEPSTWAMMLVGFGAIGFGSRRRRAKVTVSYA